MDTSTTYADARHKGPAGAKHQVSAVVVMGILQVVDFFFILASSYVAVEIYIVGINEEAADLDRYGAITLLATILFVAAMRAVGAYDSTRLIQTARNFKLPAGVFGATFLALAAVGFFLNLSNTYSRGWAGSWIGLALASLLLSRTALGLLVDFWNRHGRLSRSIAVIGTSEMADRLFSQLVTDDHRRMRLAGLFDHVLPAQSSAPRTHSRGTFNDLLVLARKGVIDEIVIALPISSSREIGEIVKKLRPLPCDIRLAVGSILSDFPVRGFVNTGGVPMIEIAERPLKHWNSVVKWLEDKIIASLMVVTLSPLMLLIALAIKLDSPGPVLFAQKRFGFNNNPFVILKFRTMHIVGSDPSGTQRTVRDDPRVTRVGRFLRRFSLDELPQLSNVLRGDMSLVGPRPHAVGMMAGHLPYDDVADYLVRHRVRPGLTGWAQGNGLRGEIDSIKKAEDRIAYDLFYIDNWSLWFDLRILARTALLVLWDKEAY